MTAVGGWLASLGAKAGAWGFILFLLALSHYLAYRQGRKVERQAGEIAALKATQEAQKRVGEAQAGDAALDAEARRKVEEAKKAPPGGQVGGKYEL